MRDKLFYNDAYTFYNAWDNVMGPVTQELLGNWRQNRNKITRRREKKTLLYKTLRGLSHNIH